MYLKNILFIESLIELDFNLMMLLILGIIFVFVIIIVLARKGNTNYDKLITMLKTDFKNGLEVVENLKDIDLKQDLILEGKNDLDQDTYQHVQEILIDNFLLQELFKEIFAEDSERRKKAALTMVEINTPQSIDYAISLLYDQNQELKDTLIRALSELESPKITTTFINYLEVCNDQLTIESLKQAILKRENESVIQLLDLLNYSSGVNLNLIIELLGDIADDRVVDPLINVLYEHEQSEVRVAAAKSLYNYKSDKVFKALLYKIEDENCHVRAQIAKLLGEFNKDKAIVYLYKMLKDNSGIVRNNAAEGLLKFGDKGIKYLVLAEEKEISSNEVKRILKSIDTSRLIKIIKETYEDQELIENSEKILKLDLKDKDLTG